MIEKVAVQIHDFIKWLIIGMKTVETPQPKKAFLKTSKISITRPYQNTTSVPSKAKASPTILTWGNR